MPFVRFARDKRGYDLIYLVHTPPPRRGKPARPRLLYFFRTPPGAKVGREPFDETVRRTLEAQNPDVVFDWAALSKIPVPSPDAEHWRERRRLEREAKQARRTVELESQTQAAPESGQPDAGERPVDDSPEQPRRRRRRRVSESVSDMVSESVSESVSDTDSEDSDEQP